MMIRPSTITSSRRSATIVPSTVRLPALTFGVKQDDPQGLPARAGSTLLPM